jgi:hypothetical protein
MVARPTKRSPGKRLPSCTAIASPTRMALASPIKTTASQRSGQLTPEQIDTLLLKLREPSLARQFLMDAGLIDAHGQLTRSYRSQDAQTA